MFLTLGDLERLRVGTEVDRPAHAADFAADGANAQLGAGESPAGSVLEAGIDDAPGRERECGYGR